MNASKEECQKALTRCRYIRGRLRAFDPTTEADAMLLEFFLETACRRLPTEKAYEADRQRHRRRRSLA